MKGDVFEQGEIVHCPLIVGPAVVVRVKVVGSDVYYKVMPARSVLAYMFTRAKWVSNKLLYKWPDS